MTVPYKYKAIVTKVIDGDTFDALVDLGFSVGVKMKFRMARINTPELHSPNPESAKKAKEARDFTFNSINGKEIVIQSHKQEKFGRYLAEVFYQRGDPAAKPAGPVLNLNDELMAVGLAEKYV